MVEIKALTYIQAFVLEIDLQSHDRNIAKNILGCCSVLVILVHDQLWLAPYASLVSVFFIYRILKANHDRTKAKQEKKKMKQEKKKQ